MTKCNPPLIEVAQITKEATDATAHYSENHHQLFMLKGGKRFGLTESQGQLDHLPVCTFGIPTLSTSLFLKEERNRTKKKKKKKMKNETNEGCGTKDLADASA